MKFGTLKQRILSFVRKEELWLRPISKSFEKLVYLTEIVLAEDIDYLEFMIHSSELMPGGSPYFKTSEDIEIAYCVMEKYFKYVSDIGFCGATLSSYADIKRKSLLMNNVIN